MTKYLKPGWLLGALAVVLALAGSATASSLITSAKIKDGTIRARDIKKGTITRSRLSSDVRASLNRTSTPPSVQSSPPQAGPAGPAGPKGDKGDRGEKGVSNLEADGPYPGRPDPENNLQGDQGDQSTAKWSSGAGLQTSWVMCAPGKVALGGGFGQDDDQTDELVIVSSSPVQIKDGKTYLDDLDVYDPIEGDPAGSFRPNGWIVQGYNRSGRDLVVRPWVVCANVD